MSEEDNKQIPQFVAPDYPYLIVEKKPLFVKQNEIELTSRKKISELFKLIGKEISAAESREYNTDNFPSRFHELTNYNGSTKIEGGIYILFYKENPVANILVTSNDGGNVYTLLGTFGTLGGVGSFNLEERIRKHFKEELKD